MAAPLLVAAQRLSVEGIRSVLDANPRLGSENAKRLQHEVLAAALAERASSLRQSASGEPEA